MNKRIQKSISFLIIFSFIFSYFYSLIPNLQNYSPEVKKAEAATMALRQEINILNSYLLGTSGAYATSSEMIAIATTSKLTNATYYLEVVASTTSSSFTASLRNATSSATITSISSINATSPTRYRSSSFTPSSDVNASYVLHISNEAVTKGIIAARIVVLQTSGEITSTQTQIEIGNNETGKTNTTNSALTSPKYWYYDSSVWDGSPTFYAEVVYKNTQVSSSTTYHNRTSTTTTGSATYIASNGVSYVRVQAWGAGGGGGCAATDAGSGGGGGAYAESTLAITQDTSKALSIGRGGTGDNAAASTDTTYDSTVVIADSGTSGVNGTIGTGGTTANSTGQIEFAGGNGGDQNASDGSGGGGGGAGTSGAGVVGVTASGSTGANGGAGNNGSGGAAGTGGGSGTAIQGKYNAGGGGGGGGSSSGGTVGGVGGAPGGGAGGVDSNTCNGNNGAGGQIILTETHGMVKMAIEEDDGNFGSWTFKKMISTNGGVTSTSTAGRVRSASFTPTTGRNYRIVASSTNASATYDIYSAKIIVDQASPTKLEPQYLIANTNGSLGAGTGLKNFDTYFDPAEWSGVLNTYYHEANGASSGTGDLKLQTDPNGTPADITGSTITDTIERERSSALTMPGSAQTIDVNVTGTGTLTGDRIIVQVTPAVTIGGTVYTTADGATPATSKTIQLYKNGSTSLGSDATDGSGVYSVTLGTSITSGDIITAYVDGDTDGVTVYVSDGTSESNVNIYQGALVVRDDVGSGITNANLTTGIVSSDTGDMVHTTDGSNNLTVSSNVELHVYTGDTYTPGATVTTQGTGNLHVDDSATVTLGSATNAIANDIVADTGATLNINANTTVGGGDITTAGTATVTYTSGTPTVTMSGTGSLGGGSNGLTFRNLTILGTITGSNNFALFNTLNVSGSLILSGGTFNLNSNTSSISNSGTLTFNNLTIVETPDTQPSSSFSVSGALTVNASKTLAPTAGTITMTGGSIVNNNTLNFYNLDIAGTVTTSATFGVTNNMTSTSGTLTTSGGTITVTGDLSVAGTITGTGNITVNGGDVTGNGTLNLTDGTFLLDGSGLFGGNTGWTFNKLTFGDGSGAATNYGQGTGSVTSATTTVANNQTLDAGVSKSWTLTASHEPFQLQGSFLASSSSFIYTAANNATVTPTTYYNLEISPSSGSPNIKLATTTGQTITVNNNFTIGGSGNATVDATTRDPILDVNGNFSIGSSDIFQASDSAAFTLAGSFTNNGTFTHNNGTLTLDTGTTATISSSANMTFYNFSVTTPSKIIKFGKHTSDVPTFSFDNQFTVTGGSDIPQSRITIQSDTSGNQWLVDFNVTQTSITYAFVRDSACLVGSLGVNYSVTNSGGGNNGSCWNIGNIGATSTPGVISVEQGSGGGTLRVGGGSGGGNGGTEGGSGGGSQQGGGGQGGGGGGTP